MHNHMYIIQTSCIYFHLEKGSWNRSFFPRNDNAVFELGKKRILFNNIPNLRTMIDEPVSESSNFAIAILQACCRKPCTQCPAKEGHLQGFTVHESLGQHKRWPLGHYLSTALSGFLADCCDQSESQVGVVNQICLVYSKGFSFV